MTAREVDGTDGVGHVARAVGVEDPQRHHLARVRDADDADAVVADRGDRARDVRAVAVGVVGQVVVVDEVPAVHVVDVAVAVVVDAVARDLARVRPDVGGEVGVVVLDPGVDDGDDDVGAAGRRVPGRLGVDVGVARLVEAPHLRQARVVGRERGGDDAVGLGVLDARLRVEAGGSDVGREVGLDDVEAGHEVGGDGPVHGLRRQGGSAGPGGRAARRVRPDGGERNAPRGRREPRLEPDEHAARGELLARRGLGGRQRRRRERKLRGRRPGAGRGRGREQRGDEAGHQCQPPVTSCQPILPSAATTRPRRNDTA